MPITARSNILRKKYINIREMLSLLYFNTLAFSAILHHSTTCKTYQSNVISGTFQFFLAVDVMQCCVNR